MHLPSKPRAGKRPFDPLKASLVSDAALLQDAEDRPWQRSVGPYFGIDVECVANGTGHLHRTPARVAVVSVPSGPDGRPAQTESVDDIAIVLDEYVRPDVAVTSYLTELTGITEACCRNARSLGGVVSTVRRCIPKDATVVGQSVKHDLEWLGLHQGEDYKEVIEISDMFRQRLPITMSQHEAAQHNDGSPVPPPRHRVFSLRHTCQYLLGSDIQTDVHCPVRDASYALFLFCKYRDVPVGMLRACRDALHRAPKLLSFSARIPVIEGVSLGKDSYRIKHSARFVWAWWLKWKHNQRQ